MDWASSAWFWTNGNITGTQTVYFPQRNVLAQVSLSRFSYPGVNYSAFTPDGTYTVLAPSCVAQTWVSEIVDGNGTHTFGPGFEDGPGVTYSPSCSKMTFSLQTTSGSAYATALVWYV